MIVFLAVRQHLYTVQSLVDGSYWPGIPEVRSLAYEDMLGTDSAPLATYIFTDFERLSAWERQLAAELFRSLQAAGCRCLNDPARVLTRYRLLRALHRARINPFRAWRLDELAPRRGLRGALAPRPSFPVFIRNEDDHGVPLTPLIESRAALETAMNRLAVSGTPLSGLLAVEYCAQPITPGVWAKFGTFRVGDIVSADHAVAEENWCVKHGSESTGTDALFTWEREQIVGNRYADALRPAFEIAGIEYGRADHATVDGREVVYEINTNPHLAPAAKQLSPIRDDALAVARARLSAALHAIDAGDGAPLSLQPSEKAAMHRTQGVRLGAPYRP